MSLVRLQEASKQYGGEFVLDAVDFRIEEGEKIGLIGRNGTGKSTIFRMILGDIEPESGVVERMRRARVACLAQLPDISTEQTIFDTVMHVFDDLLALETRLAEVESRLGDADQKTLDHYAELQEEFQRRGGYEFRTTVKRVLHGLGFRVEDFDLPVTALSGGQRSRLMLALVLLEDADLLLLDEPENHLDLEAREWLEGFLKDWPKALVIISHDRQMLNAVTTRIVEIERGRLSGFTGNYDAYQEHKALLNEQQEAAFARQQRNIAKEERFIERFRYKNTKATQVQSRIKRLDKLERVDAPISEQGTASFNLGEVVRSGAVVLDAQSLTMGYDGVPLYSDVTFQVTRGERVGIVGPNGSGKTTLLRHIAGRIEGLGGRAVLGHKVTLGYYDQHHEAMNPKTDVFGEISATRPDMKPEEVRSFMGRFLFYGEDIFKAIPSLSGGELSRVALAKLILGGANLLLLDEPTNHLDIASREALEPALAEFAGTLVVVSHDRALIDRLVDKLIVIENGRAEMHLGNYSQYRERKGGGAPAKVGAETEDVLKIRREKKKKPNKRKQNDRERRARRRELESVERDIAAMEETLADLESQFSQVDPADYETAQRLKNDYDGMKTDLTELYTEWETLADELAD